MQRFLTSLLVMMLYLASSNSSAQQFESFRHIGDAPGIAAGTVTNFTLAQDQDLSGSQVSFFNAAGLSTIYDVVFSSSRIIRDDMQVYLPSEGFREIEPSMDLDDVSFYTGSLVNQSDPDSSVPAHWFRLTFFNGTWSGAFRIADRIYSIDRSRRDNVVEVRTTPSQNTDLLPTRQLRVTALIDEEFVFADPPGDSIGLDSLGHIHALESLHIMEGVTNDSLGITMILDQLVYRPSSELASPDEWLADNATSFGIDDNFSSFIFRGDEAVSQRTNAELDTSFVVQSKLDFNQLTSAHLFGNLLGIVQENGTLQSSQNPLNAAHWSESQRTTLIANLPNASRIQMINFDAPEIEITESDEIENQIPQSILDSEIVESLDQGGNSVASGGGLFQNDETSGSVDPSQDSESGGGTFGSGALLGLVLLGGFTRRRLSQAV